MKLTQKSVDGLELPAGKSDHIFWDDELRGFGVRMRAGGSKSFIVQYERHGATRRMSIGATSKLTLSQARAAAKGALAKVVQGQDPQADKKQERTVGAFKSVADDFIRFQEGKGRRASTIYQTKLYLGYCKPLHDLPMTAIRRSDVATILSSISTNHGPYSADRARAALSKFFAWAMANGMVESNPVIGTNTHAPDNSEDAGRSLTDSEIAEIWNAAGTAGDYGRIVRLAFLTGMRRGEIAGLQWDEIQGDMICLPGSRTKNHAAFNIPLVPMAIDVIAACSSAQQADRKFVFGKPRSKDGFTGYSKAKSQLDAKLTGVAAWRFHDIRHTVSTQLHEVCGVPPHVVEAVLNHVSGAKGGVAGRYNHAAYDEQKRDALEAWASRIKVILAQANGANVSSIRRKKGVA
jgi:integrase